MIIHLLTILLGEVLWLQAPPPLEPSVIKLLCYISFFLLKPPLVVF